MSENNTVCNCGCCEDNALLTPEDTSNSPGLSALKYRVGIHYSFKQSMLNSFSKHPALDKLTARYNDDFAVATLDAWATVLDVLSFYQERIINEGYLRTATERLSILQLAKHISYRSKPGVAASTFLAFSMNEAKGAPASAMIPIGTKVQSVPEQNQLPQVFETTTQIQARVEWNNIKLQTQERFIPEFGDREIYLKGITTGLQPGDGLLMIGDERAHDKTNENWDFRKVKEVMPDKDLDITKITWSKGLGATRNGMEIFPASKNFKVYALRQKAFLFGYNAPEFKLLSDTVKDQFLPAALTGQYYRGNSFDHFVFSRLDSNINFDWQAGSPDTSINADSFSVRWTGPLIVPVSGNITFFTTSDDGVRLWVNNQLIIDNWSIHAPTENSGNIALYEGQICRIKLEYFENTGNSLIQLSWSGPGLNKQIIPAGNFILTNYNDWPNYSISAISQAADTIYLDVIYQKIVKDSWLVISTTDYQEVYKVDDVSDSSRKDFTLTAKTTAIKLSGENLLEQFNMHIRDTVVYAQSEELEIANKPYYNAIQSYQTVVLAELMPGLSAGQYIIISGKRMRLKITEAASNPLFSVEDSSIATRNLSAGDTLIILQKPEDIASAKQKWTLKDSGGFVGIIEVKKFDEAIDENKNEYVLIPADKNDDTVSELHTIDSIVAGTDPTVIILKHLLTNYFDTTTVGINANVAAATHGETKEETLGSGNPAQAFQKFVLKQKPLAYVSDAGASGAKTTLQVRINDTLWKEVSSFYGVSPKDKVYTTVIADDGKVTVQFGDGVTGARLPGGTGNVTASYRIGIGSDGLLHVGQLSMLMTPQLGVSKVINPLDTVGAADPEMLDKARENAPFTVLTLGRIVSIKDFEDFTRAFAGIGKACAQMLWNGEQQEVYITIAATEGKAVDELSDLYKNLTLAIQNSGHTYSAVSIHSYTPVTFSVDAGIQIDSNYIFDKVKAQVIEALQQKFSFERREFGQDVTLAEVMTIIQSVEGVIYVDVNKLNGHDPFTSGGTQRIVSNLARWQGSNTIPAQLVTIGEININLIL